MTTALGQLRADTAAVNQAVRALRAGVRPEQVVAALATYCGLALPPERVTTERIVEHWMTRHDAEPNEPFLVYAAPIRRRSRFRPPRRLR